MSNIGIAQTQITGTPASGKLTTCTFMQYRQGAGGNTTATTSFGVAFGGNTVAGNLLVVGAIGGSGNAFSISDSQSNVYTQITTTTQTDVITAWYAIAKSSAACTVTVTCTSQTINIVQGEYSVVGAAPTLDGSGSNKSSSASTLTVTTSSAAGPADFQIAFCGAPGSGTVSGGPGYVPRIQASNIANQWSSALVLAEASSVGSGAQAITYTGTLGIMVGILANFSCQVDIAFNPNLYNLTVQGTVANSFAQTVFGNGTTGQSYGLIVKAGTNSSDFCAFFDNTSSSQLMTIRGDGLVGIPGTLNVVTSYEANGTAGITHSAAAVTSLTTEFGLVTAFSTSDERLKKDIVPFTRGLDDLLNVKPITYHWKDDQTPYPWSGFSAQQVAETIPEASPEMPDGMLDFHYQAVLAVAVNAIKELAARVKELETKYER